MSQKQERSILHYDTIYQEDLYLSLFWLEYVRFFFRADKSKWLLFLRNLHSLKVPHYNNKHWTLLKNDFKAMVFSKQRKIKCYAILLSDLSCNSLLTHPVVFDESRYFLLHADYEYNLSAVFWLPNFSGLLIMFIIL